MPRGHRKIVPQKSTLKAGLTLPRNHVNGCSISNPMIDSLMLVMADMPLKTHPVNARVILNLIFDLADTMKLPNSNAVNIEALCARLQTQQILGIYSECPFYRPLRMISSAVPLHPVSTVQASQVSDLFVALQNAADALMSQLPIVSSIPGKKIQAASLGFITDSLACSKKIDISPEVAATLLQSSCSIVARFAWLSTDFYVPLHLRGREPEYMERALFHEEVPRWLSMVVNGMAVTLPEPMFHEGKYEKFGRRLPQSIDITEQILPLVRQSADKTTTHTIDCFWINAPLEDHGKPLLQKTIEGPCPPNLIQLLSLPLLQITLDHRRGTQSIVKMFSEFDAPVSYIHQDFNPASPVRRIYSGSQDLWGLYDFCVPAAHRLFKGNVLASVAAKLSSEASPSSSTGPARQSADAEAGDLVCEDNWLPLSLMCPLTMKRISLPVRGYDCEHLQCFDLVNYLSANRSRPRWTCPICSNYCPFRNLRLDELFKSVLEEAAVSAPNAVSVKLFANSCWRPDEVEVGEDEESEAPSEAKRARHAKVESTSATDDCILILSSDEDEEKVVSRATTPAQPNSPSPPSLEPQQEEIMLEETPDCAVIREEDIEAAMLEQEKEERAKRGLTEEAATPSPPTLDVSATNLTQVVQQTSNKVAALPAPSKQQYLVVTEIEYINMGSQQRATLPTASSSEPANSAAIAQTSLRKTEQPLLPKQPGVTDVGQTSRSYIEEMVDLEMTNRKKICPLYGGRKPKPREASPDYEMLGEEERTIVNKIFADYADKMRKQGEEDEEAEPRSSQTELFRRTGRFRFKLRSPRNQFCTPMRSVADSRDHYRPPWSREMEQMAIDWLLNKTGNAQMNGDTIAFLHCLKLAECERFKNQPRVCFREDGRFIINEPEANVLIMELHLSQAHKNASQLNTQLQKDYINITPGYLHAVIRTCPRCYPLARLSKCVPEQQDLSGFRRLANFSQVLPHAEYTAILTCASRNSGNASAEAEDLFAWIVHPKPSSQLLTVKREASLISCLRMGAESVTFCDEQFFACKLGSIIKLCSSSGKLLPNVHELANLIDIRDNSLGAHNAEMLTESLQRHYAQVTTSMVKNVMAGCRACQAMVAPVCPPAELTRVPSGSPEAKTKKQPAIPNFVRDGNIMRCKLCMLEFCLRAEPSTLKLHLRIAHSMVLTRSEEEEVNGPAVWYKASDLRPPACSYMNQFKGAPVSAKHSQLDAPYQVERQPWTVEQEAYAMDYLRHRNLPPGGLTPVSVNYLNELKIMYRQDGCLCIARKRDDLILCNIKEARKIVLETRGSTAQTIYKSLSNRYANISREFIVQVLVFDEKFSERPGSNTPPPETAEEAASTPDCRAKVSTTSTHWDRSLAKFNSTFAQYPKVLYVRSPAALSVGEIMIMRRVRKESTSFLSVNEDEQSCQSGTIKGIHIGKDYTFWSRSRELLLLEVLSHRRVLQALPVEFRTLMPNSYRIAKLRNSIEKMIYKYTDRLIVNNLEAVEIIQLRDESLDHPDMETMANDLMSHYHNIPRQTIRLIKAHCETCRQKHLVFRQTYFKYLLKQGRALPEDAFVLPEAANDFAEEESLNDDFKMHEDMFKVKHRSRLWPRVVVYDMVAVLQNEPESGVNFTATQTHDLMENYKAVWSPFLHGAKKLAPRCKEDELPSIVEKATDRVMALRENVEDIVMRAHLSYEHLPSRQLVQKLRLNYANITCRMICQIIQSNCEKCACLWEAHSRRKAALTGSSIFPDSQPLCSNSSRVTSFEQVGPADSTSNA